MKIDMPLTQWNQTKTNVLSHKGCRYGFQLACLVVRMYSIPAHPVDKGLGNWMGLDSRVGDKVF